MLPCLVGKVEKQLNPASWQTPARSDLLSTALSRALWRLKNQGVLTLESRSDSGDSRVLQRRGGQDWLRFTHAIYTGSTP